LPSAAVIAVVAAAFDSVPDFSRAVISALRSAFPFAEVTLLSAVVSWATYAFIAAAAFVFESVWSGMRVETADAEIGLMMVQSAAVTAPLEPADVADVAAADGEAVIVADGEDAALILLLLLLHPAARKPIPAINMTTVEPLRLYMEVPPWTVQVPG
jgi:hypothetical protein